MGKIGKVSNESLSKYETVRSIKEVQMRTAEEEATKRAEAEAQENAARFARTMKKPARQSPRSICHV